MSDVKFTDDNWSYDESDHTVCMNDDHLIEICTMQPIDSDSNKNWFHGDETAANSRLIESAPKMFKLLQQYRELTEMHSNEAVEKLIDLQYEVDLLVSELT